MSNAAKIFWTEFQFFSHSSATIPTLKEAQTGLNSFTKNCETQNIDLIIIYRLNMNPEIESP
jgi:hypothetical protein